MSKPAFSLTIGLAAMVIATMPVEAHGPLFSPAPETIWKGGTEITLGLHTEEGTGISEHETEYEVSVEVEYGLTADCEIGIEIPYTKRDLDGGGDAGGLGDIVLDTKYQFWNGPRRRGSVRRCDFWP